MTAPTLQNHVLVVGHGRSGTNMVLDMFDFHRATFCRNEPNELRGTAFTGLGDPMFPGTAPPDFALRWHSALSQTFHRCGARDRFGMAKDHFRNPLLARLGQAVMSRGRARALFVPRTDGRPAEEWPAPRSYFDPAGLGRATPVLKLLLTPAWVNLAHELYPGQRVVHVLRPPKGFVQSWWSRYVSGLGGGPEKVFDANQPSLARILAHFGQPTGPQPYSIRATVVSELWRWRYINEVMIDRLSGSDRYLLAPYNAVMADKTGWADRLYDFAGLTMTPDCRDRIGAMQNTLFKARKSQPLDPDLIASALSEVLADSPHRKLLMGN